MINHSCAARVLLAALTGSALMFQARGDDFSLKGQNEARYRRGYHTRATTGPTQGSFENILELTASYNRYRLYLRQRYLLPSEFNVSQTGLSAFDKRYIEYQQDDWKLRGGSFYRIWGRGLLFGTSEKLELNFDNGLEGLLVEGGVKGWDGAAFKGVHTDDTGAIRENAEGARVSYRLPYNVRLGTSLVYVDESELHPRIDRRGYELEIQRDIASLYLAFVNDRPGFSEYLPPPIPQYPHGFYGAFSTGSMNWGLLLDYKNYRLLVEDPYSDFPQPLLQYPPTTLPEATMTLLDRINRNFKPYIDEVGVQMELTASYGDLNGRLNMNMGSEQNGGRILPSVQKKSARYNGVFLYIERSILDGHRLILQGGHLVDIQLDPPDRDSTRWYRRDAIGAEYDYPLTGRLTLQSELEMMWFVQDHGSDKVDYTFKSYRDEAFTVGVTHSPLFSLNTFIVRSGEESETGGLKWDDGHRYWPSAELTVNIAAGHQFRLFGGHERGGLRCSGGLCRLVNPFRGVKITLTSQF